MYNWSFKRREEINGAEAIFEEIMAENFLKLLKDVNRIAKQYKSKTG